MVRHLIHIPREIRDQIYRELLVSNTGWVLPQRYAYPKPGLHTAILRTCKLFYNEAVAILYEENKFRYSAKLFLVDTNPSRRKEFEIVNRGDLLTNHLFTKIKHVSSLRDNAVILDWLRINVPQIVISIRLSDLNSEYDHVSVASICRYLTTVGCSLKSIDLYLQCDYGTSDTWYQDNCIGLLTGGSFVKSICSLDVRSQIVITIDGDHKVGFRELDMVVHKIEDKMQCSVIKDWAIVGVKVKEGMAKEKVSGDHAFEELPTHYNGFLIFFHHWTWTLKPSKRKHSIGAPIFRGR